MENFENSTRIPLSHRLIIQIHNMYSPKHVLPESRLFPIKQDAEAAGTAVARDSAAGAGMDHFLERHAFEHGPLDERARLIIKP